MFRRKLLALAIIVGLILLNNGLFATFFETNYLHWYIQNGTFISFGITFISFVSQSFNKDVDTVSADPLTYGLTYLVYLAIPLGLLGKKMEINAGLSEEAREFAEAEQVDRSPSMSVSNETSLLARLINSLFMLLWAPILLLIPLLWILVVVPPQYFVFLICGAPARYIHQGDFRAVVDKKDNEVVVRYARYSEELAKGTYGVSLGIEPFPLTNLLSILFFEGIKLAFL